MQIKEIEQRYREAWLVARRVPSGIYLGHTHFWPEIQANRWEVYRSEGRPQVLPHPPAEAVDRMVESMRWLRWVEPSERELIWLRASGLPWRLIAEEFGVNRKTSYTHWHKAITRISIHLAKGRRPA